MRQKSRHEKIHAADGRRGEGRVSKKDRLFEADIHVPGDFVFDDRVVSVFPDMISRSVPGYGLMVTLIGMLARRYARDGSRLYDLGCSLGAVALAMRASIAASGAEIHAVDSSMDMIRRLEQVLESGPRPGETPVFPRHQDIRDTEIMNASVVVLNFTLQFLEPGARQGVIDRIYDGLLPGGLLLLSEKVRFDDPCEQALQTDWHHDFKRAQGYSELEIARKRDALENVLRPDSSERHRKRLEAAGFERIHSWFQAFSFLSIAAIK